MQTDNQSLLSDWVIANFEWKYSYLGRNTISYKEQNTWLKKEKPKVQECSKGHNGKVPIHKTNKLCAIKYLSYDARGIHFRNMVSRMQGRPSQ